MFIALSLPFQEIRFVLSPQAFAAVLLIVICKTLEFQMSAAVLRQLSAFELKAWLGISLFASYMTDIFYGEELRAAKLICIFATILGLVFIARSADKEKTDYRKIFPPLLLYIASKYGYGLVIKGFSAYISPTAQLLPALVIISLVLLAKVSPAKLFKENPKGVLRVVLARIPNAAGMLLENAVIAVSLTDYSFIQPMILVTLFIIGLIRREQRSPLKLTGSIICIAGVAAFQIL